MRLHAGARLAVRPIDHDRALLLKYPENRAAALRGLGKEVWQELGGGTRYIRQERASWRKKSALTR